MTAKIKTIVFPTDFSGFSAAALPWARQLADDLNAEIHCLYVVEEPHIYSTLDLGPVNLPTMAELEESAAGRLDRPPASTRWKVAPGPGVTAETAPGASANMSGCLPRAACR